MAYWKNLRPVLRKETFLRSTGFLIVKGLNRKSCSCSNDAASVVRYERRNSRFEPLRFDQVERLTAGVVLVLSAAVLVLVLE